MRVPMEFMILDFSSKEIFSRTRTSISQESKQLTFFLFITIFPYTKISLNRKNWRAFGRFRHTFVSTPSPTRTRPGTASGWKFVTKSSWVLPTRARRRYNTRIQILKLFTCPELPKQFSTIEIRRALASLLTENG